MIENYKTHMSPGLALPGQTGRGLDIRSIISETKRHCKGGTTAAIPQNMIGIGINFKKLMNSHDKTEVSTHPSSKLRLNFPLSIPIAIGREGMLHRKVELKSSVIAMSEERTKKPAFRSHAEGRQSPRTEEETKIRSRTPTRRLPRSVYTPLAMTIKNKKHVPGPEPALSADRPGPRSQNTVPAPDAGPRTINHESK